MKIRLNSGVTYQSRANIFPPIKKEPKKINKILEKSSMYDKIHQHFSKFDLLKLNFFGDDYENYGNVTLKGISYPPKKIKMDYITKRVHEEEETKNNKKIFNFEEEDDIINDTKFDFLSLPNKRKINKNLNYIKLPLLKATKNNSMENLQINKLDFINNKNIRNKNKNSDINYVINNIYHSRNINNKSLKNHKSKSYINKEKNLPILHNNISVTNKNIKLFLQTNKLEVKTDKNIKNHILNRNSFLRRYDNTTGLNNKLIDLNNDIKKVNRLISKEIIKNDEDIPQFKMRFNHLFSKFHIN